MTGSHGQFCWYELMTTDPKAAEAFYSAVVGWRAQPIDGGYTLLMAGGQSVAGVMALSEETRGAGSRPLWIGYIAVDDIERAVADLRDAGGAVVRPPADIPTIGRLCVVRDPHGAAFVLMQPDPRSTPPAPPGSTPGYVGWRELQAGDPVAAMTFYSEQFGWRPDVAMDMGPVGSYQLFTTGSEPVGGIMAKMPDMPTPVWLYYFSVEDIDAAAERVKQRGGELLMEPMEVPGGGWIVQAFDPQGAMFALTGPRL